MKIVFIGTPDFAVASLKALVENNYNVIAVVTAPDKPAGRGRKIHLSAVKEYALSQEIPVLQPKKLKSKDFLKELEHYQADIQVVVAFRMLPEVVWNMPQYGTINVHASLLPNYRGAAPINWAIINGEKATGVTTFRLRHKIDTGDILLQKEVVIKDDDNVGTLYEKLMNEGAHLLLTTLDRIAKKNITPIAQQELKESKHAPKIFKEDCIIDWNKGIIAIHNFIRGLSPYPCAFTYINDKSLKIYQSEIEKNAHTDTIGSHHSDGKTYLKFATKDGYIHATEVQLQGKKKMLIADFLRGYKEL